MDYEHVIPAEDLCRMYQVEHRFFDGLCEAGLLHTVTVSDKQCINTEELVVFEKYCRLHQDLDINLEGVAAIAYLLERIQSMQEELRALRQELKRHERN